MTVPPGHTERRTALLFWAIAACVLALMLALVPAYGSSGDELSRYNYGKAVLDFYTGIDMGNYLPGTAAEGDYYNVTFQPYGALFDGTVSWLIHLFRPDDEFLFRHYANVLTGFAALVLAGLIGREITGRWSGAVITFLLLAITPRFFGECFNNPKDVPFAAAVLFFILALFRWLKQLHQPRRSGDAMVAAGLAMGMCIRPGGLLFLVYFGAVAGIAFLRDGRLRTPAYILRVSAILLFAYFSCVLFWPMAWQHPLTAPFLSFKSQSKYLVAISVLFEGYFTDCKNLPWYYTHKLLLLTTPLVVLAGFAVSLCAAVSHRSTLHRGFLGLLLAFLLFPLISMVLRGSVFYDGIRQVLFLVVMMVICSAAGLWQLWQWCRTKRLAGICLLGISLGMLLPVRYSLANHPNQYIYYNELTGGVKGAFSNYELDYYYNSVAQAYRRLQQHEGATIKASPDSLTLLSDCALHFRYHYNKVGRLPIRIADGNLYSQHKTDWDYAIFVSRYLDHEELKHGYFNSPKAIHVIRAEGVPICIVLKNDRTRYGYKAHLAAEAGRYAEADSLLQLAVAQYPGDVELWTDLTLLYLKTHQPQRAEWAVHHALHISSVNHNTVHLSWETAFLKGDLQQAIRILTFATQYYRGTDAPWLRLAEAYALHGDLAKAKEIVQRTPVVTPADAEIYARLRKIPGLWP